MAIVGLLLAALMGITLGLLGGGGSILACHSQVRGGLRSQGGHSLEPRGGGPDKPLRRHRTLEGGQRERARRPRLPDR